MCGTSLALLVSLPYLSFFVLELDRPLARFLLRSPPLSSFPSLAPHPSLLRS
jgi:hypothetical protein